MRHMSFVHAPALKGRLAFASVGVAAFALGALAFLLTRGVGDGGGQAIADLGPNPPQAPAISGVWPDFTGQVLHWQNYSYSFQPGSPDSANGEEIRGDIWVQVGPDNRPIALRGTFARPDGSFHQDYLYANGRGIVVYDQPVEIPGEDLGQLTCRQESALDDETFRRLVDTGEPAFVDYGRVASAGFVRADTEPAESPPLEPAGFGVAPQRVLGDSVGVDEVWSKQSTPESGGTLIDSLQIDAGGRLVAEVHTGHGPDGSELFTLRRAFTEVEVFSGQDAAVQSVFDPKTLSEGCGA